MNLQKAIEQLTVLTDDYASHLMQELHQVITASIPAKDEAKQQYMQEILKGLDENQQKRIDQMDLRHYPTDANADATLLFSGFIDTIMSNLDIITRSPNPQEVRDAAQELFKKEKRSSADQQLFDLFYDRMGTEVALIVDKLEMLAELRLNLQNKSIYDDFENNQPATNAEQQILERYKSTLRQCHEALDQHRNPGWDRFFNVASVILFPIAICRSIYSHFKRGTLDFSVTKGAALCNQAEKLISEQEAQEPALAQKL